MNRPMISESAAIEEGLYECLPTPDEQKEIDQENWCRLMEEMDDMESMDRDAGFVYEDDYMDPYADDDFDYAADVHYTDDWYDD